MSTYDWPTEKLFVPQMFQWGAQERVGVSESPITGDIDTSEVPFAYRYRITLGWAPTPSYAEQHRRLGFVAKIRRSHRIRIPCFSLLAPAGTLRGTPTVASGAAQGATTVAITTSTSGHTVRIGDLLGLTTAIGTQVVTVVADATASGTALTATFEPPLRAAVSGGTSVDWDAPAPLFILNSPEWAASFRPKEAQPVVLDFLEVW